MYSQVRQSDIRLCRNAVACIAVSDLMPGLTWRHKPFLLAFRTRRKERGVAVQFSMLGGKVGVGIGATIATVLLAGIDRVERDGLGANTVSVFMTVMALPRWGSLPTPFVSAEMERYMKLVALTVVVAVRSCVDVTSNRVVSMLVKMTVLVLTDVDVTVWTTLDPSGQVGLGTVAFAQRPKLGWQPVPQYSTPFPQKPCCEQHRPSREPRHVRSLPQEPSSLTLRVNTGVAAASTAPAADAS